MKKPFLMAVVAGIVTMLLFVVLTAVLPKGAEVPAMPDGMITPVVAFEFARTVDDLTLIFGQNPETRALLAAKFDLGNKLDYLYMLSYAAMMFFFGLGLRHKSRNLTTVLLPMLAVLVLGADAMENVQLLTITSRLDGDTSLQLFLLQIFTWLKWGGLALYFALLARPVWSENGVVGKMMAVCGVFSLLCGIAAFAHRSIINEIFALFVGLDFVLLVILSWKMREKTIAVN